MNLSTASASFFLGRIEIARGDITEQSVDAIVNAANTTLLGGGGVDGAIHRAAGPELLEACRALGGCPTGEAKITRGYALPARHVLHTVGPVWRGGGSGEDDLLTSCYRNSLKLARQVGCVTVAFPAISCGVYRFPLERAARVSIEAVEAELKTSRLPAAVKWILFDADAYDAWLRELQRVSARNTGSIPPREKG